MLPHIPAPAPSDSPERSARLQALRQRLLPLVEQAALDLASALLDLPDEQLFGRIEFTLRDRVHRLAADVHQTELDTRKKGGIKAPASSVTSAATTPNSRATSIAVS